MSDRERKSLRQFFSSFFTTKKTNKIAPNNSSKVSNTEIQITQLTSRPMMLKPLPPKYDLSSRIVRYNLLQNTLLKLNNILNTNTCLDKKLNSYDNKSYTYKIKDIITLSNKIGSQSEYGTIYKTVIHDNPINIATKVMSASSGNRLETKLMKAITEQIILTKKSKHFVIMYCYSLCKAIIKSEYALANFNELALDDINTLIIKEQIENRDELYNLLIQTFLSIGTFHNFTGYIHTDCHTKNFLYIKNTENKENGYYHYVLNDKNYYLKSCKYDVMIYDFGLSKNIEMDDEILRDYILGIIILTNRNNNGPEYSNSKIISFNNHINDKIEDYRKQIVINDYLKILYDIRNNISTTQKDIIALFINIIDKLNKIKISYNTKNHDILKIIFTEVLKICLEYFPHLFFTDIVKLPSGSIILNNGSPFELYSRYKIVLDNRL
jgi:hypothetical protein